MTEGEYRSVDAADVRDISAVRRKQVEIDRWKAALRTERVDYEGIGSDRFSSEEGIDPHAVPRGILRAVLWGLAAWAFIVAIAAVALVLFS
jgi:hypothetical protein